MGSGLTVNSKFGSGPVVLMVAQYCLSIGMARPSLSFGAYPRTCVLFVSTLALCHWLESSTVQWPLSFIKLKVTVENAALLTPGDR